MMHKVKEQQASVASAERKPLLRHPPQTTASTLQPRRVLVKGNARRDLKENAVAAAPPSSPVLLPSRLAAVKASPQLQRHEKANEGRVLYGVAKECRVTADGGSEQSNDGGLQQPKPHSICKGALLVSSTYSTPIKPLFGTPSRFQTPSSKVAASDKVCEDDKECPKADAPSSATKSAFSGRVPLSILVQRHNSLLNAALSPAGAPYSPATPSRFQTPSSRTAAADKVSENDKVCLQSDAPSSTTKSPFSGRVPISILLQRHNCLLNAATSPAGAPCSLASPSRFQTPSSKVAVSDKASENNKECPQSAAPSSTTKSAFSERLPLSIILQRHSSLLNAATSPAGAPCSPASPSGFAKRVLVLPQVSTPARRVPVHDKSSKKSERKTSIFATHKTSSVDRRKPCVDENLHQAKKNLEGLLTQARTPKRVAVAEAVASSSSRSCRTGRQKLSPESKDQKV